MTHEEAIAILKETLSDESCVSVDQYDEAVNVAIAAIEQNEKYNAQYLDDINNLFEPLKISSALNSEIMKLKIREARKPEEISILDYTIIACLQKVLKEVSE